MNIDKIRELFREASEKDNFSGVVLIKKGKTKYFHINLVMLIEDL